MILIISDRQNAGLTTQSESLPEIFDVNRNPVSNLTTAIVNEILYIIHNIQLDSRHCSNAFMYPVAVLVHSSHESNNANSKQPLYHIKAGVLIGSTKLDRQTLVDLYKNRSQSAYTQLHEANSIAFNAEGTTEKGFVNLEAHNEDASLSSTIEYTNLKLSTQEKHGEIKCISNDSPKYSNQFSLLGNEYGTYFLRKDHITTSIDAGVAIYCANTGEGLAIEELPKSSISKLPYHHFCKRFTDSMLHQLFPKNEKYHCTVGPLLPEPQYLLNATSRFLHAIQEEVHTSNDLLLQQIASTDRAFYVNYYCRLAAITTSKALYIKEIEPLTTSRARKQCLSWGVTSCLVTFTCGIAYLPGYLLLSTANRMTYQVVAGQQTLNASAHEIYQTLELLRTYTPRLSDLTKIMESVNQLNDRAHYLYQNAAYMISSKSLQESIGYIAGASKSLVHKLSQAISSNSTDPKLNDTIAQLNASSASMQERLINIMALKGSITSVVEQLQANSNATSLITTGYNQTVQAATSDLFPLSTFQTEIRAMQSQITHTLYPSINGLTNNALMTHTISDNNLITVSANLTVIALLFIFINEGCQTCLKHRKHVVNYDAPTPRNTERNTTITTQPTLTPSELEAQLLSDAFKKEGIELNQSDNATEEDRGHSAYASNITHLTPLPNGKENYTFDPLPTNYEEEDDDDNDDESTSLLNTTSQKTLFSPFKSTLSNNSNTLTNSSKATNKGYAAVPSTDNEEDQDFDSEIPLHTQIQHPLLKASDA